MRYKNNKIYQKLLIDAKTKYSNSNDFTFYSGIKANNRNICFKSKFYIIEKGVTKATTSQIQNDQKTYRCPILTNRSQQKSNRTTSKSFFTILSERTSSLPRTQLYSFTGLKIVDKVMRKNNKLQSFITITQKNAKRNTKKTTKTNS